MPKNRIDGNLALAGYNDIFGNTTSIMSGERITELPLSELHSPDYHPFQVVDDEAMTRLADNIKQYGVREPGLARPRADGGYELLCGNRRKRACELAELTTMPVIIREFDDDSAIIVIVDSNLQQREKILPSERAYAYRAMMEALNHSGVKGEIHSHEIMAERTGVKKSQLFRIIRLTELITVLIDKVDAKQLAFNPAVEISYLSIKEQTAVIQAMAKYEVKPSLSQAIRLRELRKDGKLTIDVIDTIIAEEKKPPKGDKSGSLRFRKYFPPEYSQKQMEAVIVKLLTAWRSEAAV